MDAAATSAPARSDASAAGTQTPVNRRRRSPTTRMTVAIALSSNWSSSVPFIWLRLVRSVVDQELTQAALVPRALLAGSSSHPPVTSRSAEPNEKD